MYIQTQSFKPTYYIQSIFLFLILCIYLAIQSFIYKYFSVPVHHDEHRRGNDRQLPRLPAHILLSTGWQQHTFCFLQVGSSTHSAFYRLVVVLILLFTGWQQHTSALYRLVVAHISFLQVGSSTPSALYRLIEAHILLHTGQQQYTFYYIEVSSSTHSALYRLVSVHILL